MSVYSQGSGRSLFAIHRGQNKLIVTTIIITCKSNHYLYRMHGSLLIHAHSTHEYRRTRARERVMYALLTDGPPIQATASHCTAPRWTERQRHRCSTAVWPTLFVFVPVWVGAHFWSEDIRVKQKTRTQTIAADDITASCSVSSPTHCYPFCHLKPSFPICDEGRVLHYCRTNPTPSC